MIVRWHDEDLFICQKAAAVDRGLSKHTVRAKLSGRAAACDVATRAPLYVREEAAEVLEAVKPRPARSADAQRARRVLAAA